MFKIFPLCLLACISGFAAANPGANSDSGDDPVVEQASSIRDRVSEDEEAPVTVTEAINAAKKRREQAAEVTPTLWQRHSSEWTALLALLVLWLIARLFAQPDIEVKRRTKRHSPLNPDEFARILYQALMSGDVEAYRTMYLTGTEACQIMGDADGAAYLKNRSPEVFELAFDSLVDRMPAGVRYEKGNLSSLDVVELWVLDPTGMRHRIPVGKVANIGAVMRLISPLVGDAATPRVEYVGKPD